LVKTGGEDVVKTIIDGVQTDVVEYMVMECLEKTQVCCGREVS
jgi:hypothetical protein